MQNFSDIVECYRCKKRLPRLGTVIIQNPKGRFRLCKECYIAYEKAQMKKQYETTKENINKFQLYVNPDEVMEVKKKFLESLKGEI